MRAHLPRQYQAHFEWNLGRSPSSYKHQTCNSMHFAPKFSANDRLCFANAILIETFPATYLSGIQRATSTQIKSNQIEFRQTQIKT